MGSAPSAQDTAEARDDTHLATQHLEELRRLLLGPEQVRIREIQVRLNDPQLRAEELSHIVAEAIALRTRRDQAFQRSLYPVVEEALRISVVRHPHILAESLFPIIGEAVRKAVAHALRGMVESLNQLLDNKFSLQSLQWRIEARRTGKSFGEIALMRSLCYRVEQVFLIHRETGLLLQHVAAREQGVQDTDLVSGMLTAVQDFVRDSFGAKKSEDLETMQVGDYTVWLQHGPLALLAAVVSGTPPPELRTIFQRELEKIHGEFGGTLSSFSGDASKLAGARANLQRCLLGSEKKVEKRRSYFAAWAGGALGLLILVLVFLWARDTHRWNLLVTRLRSEPGIVVTDAEKHWGRYTLAGLRDPMAADPHAILQTSGLAVENVSQRWEPYLSLDPRFALLRRFAADRELLEDQVLHFPMNSWVLQPEEVIKLETVETLVRKVQTAARSSGQKLTVEVYGHTDSTGQETANALLSRRRAEVVVEGLVERGIDPGLLKALGVGDRAPAHPVSASYPTELNRRVNFRVTVPNRTGAR
jgi:outer membrane protein OmpA-like peptidoglycan-associated protein